MKSQKYKLNIDDALKGALITCAGTLAGLLVESQGDDFQFLNALKIGAISGIVYLLKNLFENEKGEL